MGFHVPGGYDHADSQACLPPEVERLLLDVVSDGFILYCCGPITAPFVLVASYQWEDYVDLVTIRCFDRVTTARVPAPQRGRIDVFAPEVVVWAHEAPPQRALRVLLDLVHPQHPYAPVRAYPAPPSLRIPRAEQRPMKIKLPSPDRAGMRATRLAAAMAAGDSDPIMTNPTCVENEHADGYRIGEHRASSRSS
ncbi:MAG: hypothetical protein ACRDTA_22280 [Pseudonocardiaceae bacterium]